MSGQIVSNFEATVQQALRLTAGAQGYGDTAFSCCSDISDAIAASQHDDAGRTYSSAAEAYKNAIDGDARAITRMGDAFQRADALRAELMRSLG